MPGFLDQVQTAAKLRAFLTPRNLQFLGILLEIVTDEDSPAFPAVWARFAGYFPAHPKAPSQALSRLRALRRILEESGSLPEG